MPEPVILPLVAIRARKIASLLALAHHEGIPVPSCVTITDHDALADVEFHATSEEFAAWIGWLNATSCRDYPGSRYRTALATAQLAEWGPVTVRVQTEKEAS